MTLEQRLQAATNQIADLRAGSPDSTIKALSAENQRLRDALAKKGTIAGDSATGATAEQLKAANEALAQEQARSARLSGELEAIKKGVDAAFDTRLAMETARICASAGVDALRLSNPQAGKTGGDVKEDLENAKTPQEFAAAYQRNKEAIFGASK